VGLPITQISPPKSSTAEFLVPVFFF
jgi:hypothetical protein